MKTILRTKLTIRGDKQFVELRDYEIKPAIANKQSVRVEHDSEFMVLTWRELKKGKIVNTQISKFYPYDKYLMLEYEWNPYKNLDEKPTSLNSFLVGLSPSQISELRAKLGIDK